MTVVTTLSYRRYLAKSYTGGMTVNQLLHKNYKKLNEDPFLQGLALGFWEAKFTCLEYKQQSMMENMLNLEQTYRLSKNIHNSASRIIRQLNDFKPCNQNGELIKQLLLLKYNKILTMTLENPVHD